jgi:rubrerythrin
MTSNITGARLTSEQQAALVQEMQRGSFAYVRNLAAAEQAVQRGQFNVAKVLRAAANGQRVIAFNAARIVEAATLPPATTHLSNNLSEQQTLLTANDEGQADVALQTFVKRASTVHERIANLLQRSLNSLATAPDILERDVPMMLFSCRYCGNPVEGNQPEQCDLCGAIQAEFQYIGPFYSGTAERLGRLSPQQVVEILQQGPSQVTGLIADVDDQVLQRKPSADEWSVKEIVAHILETDYLCVEQVKAILTQTTYVVSVAPWKTHIGKHYEELSSSELIERMTTTRAETLVLLQHLAPSDWSKMHYIWERAASVLDVGTWHANHDIGHLAQVRRLLAMWQIEPTAPSSLTKGESSEQHTTKTYHT